MKRWLPALSLLAAALRLDAQSPALRPEFQVNQITTQHQSAARVASDANGNFVAVCEKRRRSSWARSWRNRTASRRTTRAWSPTGHWRKSSVSRRSCPWASSHVEGTRPAIDIEFPSEIR